MLNPTAPRHGRQVPSLVVAQEAGSYHGRNQPWSAATGNPFSPSDSVRVYTPDVLVATLNTLPTLKADRITMSVYEDASTTNLWNMIVGNGHDVDGDALTISTIDTTGTVGSVIFDKVGKKLVYTADDTIQDLLQPGDTDTTVVKYKLSDGKE